MNKKKPELLDLINCVKREISQRERVYPKMIDQGKMTEKKAEWEILCMKEILKYLDNLHQPDLF